MTPYIWQLISYAAYYIWTKFSFRDPGTAQAELQVSSKQKLSTRFHIIKAVTSFHDLGFDKYHEVFGNNLEIRILGLWMIRSTKALLISRRVLLILSFRHFIFIILFCCHTVISCPTQLNRQSGSMSNSNSNSRQSSSVCTHCSKIITRT